MTLTVGTNSFISLEDAEVYFTDRLTITSWDDADNASKESALITATNLLNVKNWVGYTEDEDQVLAFPREGEYYEPINGQYILFDGIPSRIKKATCETALHHLKNDNLLDNKGSTLSVLKVGQIQLEGNIGAKSLGKLPTTALDLIKPLLRVGGNSWWRAN